MEGAESSVILNMYKQVLSVKLKRPECSGVYFDLLMVAVFILGK